MAHTKQTIAIIGIGNPEKQFEAALAKKICEGNFRVVMFDENLDEAISIKEQISQSNQNADIDVADCKHMASWEADIIVISADKKELNSVAKRIVDVSTQKIVALLSDSGSGEELDELEEMFPHSKVSVLIPGEEEVTLWSRDERSLKALQELIVQSGYKAVIQTAA